jgi:hypothetical protein
VIYDCKAVTYKSNKLSAELEFLITVLSQPDRYPWASPIAHIIPLEAEYDTLQDSSIAAAGGFCRLLLFWWSITWPQYIYLRTLKFIPNKQDKHLISINMLEYAALIIGFAGTVVAWEALPPSTRPPTPLVTLLTDNTAARAWTSKIAGLKSPQGRALARLFAHLLMFSAVGIESRHIAGTDNDIADYLSRFFKTAADTPHISFSPLQKQNPWLSTCRRFLPSRELLSLLYSALQNGSVNLPATRVNLGQIHDEQRISNTFSQA